VLTADLEFEKYLVSALKDELGNRLLVVEREDMSLRTSVRMGSGKLVVTETNIKDQLVVAEVVRFIEDNYNKLRELLESLDKWWLR